ncbi:GGDEF domain-containing protein, partial [Treponema sp.]|uniref:GGDEF domain-containing protein n=1 Tax=Treponema sp. TaxID=166 RepID=UPI00298E4065
IIDNIESEHTLKIMEGVSSFFKDTDVNLLTYQIGSLIDDQDPYNYQNKMVDTLISKNNTDGIIFLALPHFHFESNEYLVEYLSQFEGIPIVSIGYISDKIPSITYNSANSIAAITEHLIKVHGHKRIALFAVGTGSNEALERENAFRETLKKNGIEYDENLTMNGAYDYDEATESLLEHKKQYGYDFDAIVSVDDDMAFACIDELAREGIDIPSKIAVTGFDNSVRSYSEKFGLTTASQNAEGQGAAAAKMIFDIVSGNKTETQICIPSKPIFRESCGCKRDHNNDEFEPLTVADWFTQRNQFISVIKLYTLMQFELPFSAVRSKLKYELITVGIKDACIVLFEKPISTKKSTVFQLPDKAFVAVSFNSENTYEIGETNETIGFNPRETIIPPGLLKNLNGMIVMALYRFSKLIGYIIFKPGDFDLSIYSLMHKIISNSLVASMKISHVEDENKNLLNEVTEVSKTSVSDELTGLLNRRGLMQFGQNSIDTCVAMKNSGSVIFTDLDGLKYINDTFGHEAGDKAIVASAKILRKLFRENDIIARLGGDEFCVVAPGLKGSVAESLPERLAAECEEYNKDSGEKFTLSMSVGQALFTPSDATLELQELLVKADSKLYEEKRRKKEAKRAEKKQ